MKKGELIAEGKTKTVYEVQTDANLVYVVNKDEITANNGKRVHVIKNKGSISNETNAKVFEILHESGIKTSFLQSNENNSYVARKCYMVPIEWVIRRVATGSFLKRNPGVSEGYKFSPPKLETFLKDDGQDDPLWSKEQILEAKLKMDNLLIGELEYETMAKTAVTVFEILERAWATVDCTLVDLKIEFGVDSLTHQVLVSDVIDSDSWRLWPSGDKEKMVDKQVYRNAKDVTEEVLRKVRKNYEWVVGKLNETMPNQKGLVVILVASGKDAKYAEDIVAECRKFGLETECKITSAHKNTEDTLQIVADYESHEGPVVFIAVAGRSNGLGPVLAGNSCIPVINCPPLTTQDCPLDIWSSLRVPSGVGCTTVLYPETAAQAAASIFALKDHEVWSKLRVKKLELWKQRKIEEKAKFGH